jgi:hypothetical protein
VAVTSLFDPIPVKYTGLYSDDHVIDLQEFGASLQGLAKFANSIVNFYLQGEVVKDSRLYRVRLYAAPPEPGCVLLDIVALMAAGQLPLWAPLVCQVATQYIVPLIKATIATRLKRPDMTEKALDQIVELAKTHAAFADKVHDAHMKDKAWLQKQVDVLSRRNAAPLKQLVNPVGSTCRQIEVGHEMPGAPSALIGEAEAQALASPEELSVDDMREFRGIFDGVDTTNGICKFRVQGTEGDIPGKITDPALILPKNVYTHSLDTKQAVTIKAKAVTRDGAIVRLFISDGRS